MEKIELSTPLNLSDGSQVGQLNLNPVQMKQYSVWEKKGIFGLASEVTRIPLKDLDELEASDAPALMNYVRGHSLVFAAIRDEAYIEFLNLKLISEKHDHDILKPEEPIDQGEDDPITEIKLNRPKLRHFRIYCEFGLSQVVSDLTLLSTGIIESLPSDIGSVLYYQAYKRLKPFLAIH